MTEQEIKLIFGSLLHDVGKVIYHTGNNRKHSRSGYEFLTGEAGITDPEVLDSVLYHHAEELKKADIANHSYAYITYIADNIASAADRRKKEAEDYVFEVSEPLQPVFNILNKNSQRKYYRPMMLGKEINYPVEDKVSFDENFYNTVKQKLLTTLKGTEWKEQDINALLGVLEVTLSYLPSSAAEDGTADISLYDHVKLTAAISSCIYQYLMAEHIDDFHQELFRKEQEFYGKKAFLFYSMDVSGIQKFIYTIQSKDALKSLRARSFYLELMMEHIMDSLLEGIGLTKANIIYSGGGHCYLLLPNTAAVKQYLEEYEKEVNLWLQQKFDIALYIASGYAEASANDFKNEPENSYAELYRTVSNALSEKKTHRYSAKDIITLNRIRYEDYGRECKVCKRTAAVGQNGVCGICTALKEASKDILYQPFFIVTKEAVKNALPLPGDCYLIAGTEDTLKQCMRENTDSYVRAYVKNDYDTGLHTAKRIWIGNYTKGQTFEQLAEESEGIKRIGIIRADVDNLGQAFVSGLDRKYSTLSRSAALSRHLSLFFKYYINFILEDGTYNITRKENTYRNATIVYSGGDDLFIVGAWDEIIGLAVDIRDAFARYTQGSLSLSAGIGVYSVGYPISRIAYEVGELESMSKKKQGKNSLTIFPDGIHKEMGDGMEVTISDGTYSWDTFVREVAGEKYSALRQFFEQSQDRGKNFLYRLLELIRKREEPINFARYVYILSRMEPGEEASEVQKILYNNFAKQMYKWMLREEDCRQLRTAMNLYAYLVREEEEGK